MYVLKRMGIQPENFEKNQDLFSIYFNMAAIFLQVVKFDFLNLDGFPRSECFRYEDYTQSDAELRKLIKAVLPPRLHDIAGRIERRKFSKINHASSIVGNAEVLKHLHSRYNFSAALIQEVEVVFNEQYAASFLDRYTDHGYDLVKMARDIMLLETTP